MNKIYKNTFFPSTILEWNKLDPSLQNSASYVFVNSILEFIRASSKKIFQCHNPKGIKLATRLRLGLSLLWEHKFNSSFQDTLNPLCSCGLSIETLYHYFRHCPLFHINDLLSWIILMKLIIQNFSCDSFPAIWWRIFQGWSKFANLACNSWFCFVYKQIWWITLSSLNSRVFFFLFIIIWLQFHSF